MANTEVIHLNLTDREADSVAYVLMAALHTTSMLDSERKDATESANALFKQLKYGHGCDSHGNRKEWEESAPTVKEWNDRRKNNA
jgi:hypothetical protein